jgi:ribosomal subunit interface protein
MARIPLQITSRNFEITGDIEQRILKKSEKLDKFHRDMMSCRVLLEVPHRNRNSGVVYNARIDLAMPGKDIVVRREAHEDLHKAINLAFDAALRRLQSHARRKRGEVKRRDEPFEDAQEGMDAGVHGGRGPERPAGRQREAAPGSREDGGPIFSSLDPEP